MSYKIISLIKTTKLLLILVGLIMITSCDKDDDQSPIEQLPSISQNGAQTFGCLINGEPFKPPRLGRNSPRAFYQYVRGAYTLNISGSTGGGTELKTISIGAIDVSRISEGSYELFREKSGNFYGEYSVGGSIDYTGISSEESLGILVINNHNEEKFIISGTFSFTVQDENGKEIKITDGRFDLNYTN